MKFWSFILPSKTLLYKILGSPGKKHSTHKTSINLKNGELDDWARMPGPFMTSQSTWRALAGFLGTWGGLVRGVLAWKTGSHPKKHTNRFIVGALAGT